MTLEELIEKAKSIGIKEETYKGLDKYKLIQIIQLAEGNFPCFGRATSGYCDQQKCIFREDCLKQNF